MSTAVDISVQRVKTQESTVVDISVQRVRYADHLSAIHAKHRTTATTAPQNQPLFAVGGGPTLNKHWFTVSDLLGVLYLLPVFVFFILTLRASAKIFLMFLYSTLGQRKRKEIAGFFIQLHSGIGLVLDEQ